MKKVLVLLLCLFCILPFAACKLPEFIPSKDLTIVAAYVENESGYILVKNQSEKTFQNFSTICIYFDSAGNVLNDGKPEVLENSFAIDAGGYSIPTFTVPSGCAYLSAAIYDIEATASGSATWKAQNIFSWEKNTIDSFSVDEYNASLSDMHDTFGKLAENNDYFSISTTTQTDRLVTFDLKNLSDTTPTSLRLMLLEYAANGQPVTVGAAAYCQNVSFLEVTDLPAPGDSTSFSSESETFLHSDTATYKMIVSEIIFEDGTVWENPYQYHWMISNKNLAD